MKKIALFLVILFVAGSVFGQDARFDGAWVVNISDSAPHLDGIEICISIYKNNEVVQFLGGHISTRWSFVCKDNKITYTLIRKYSSDIKDDIGDTDTLEYWFSGNSLFLRDTKTGVIEKFNKL